MRIPEHVAIIMDGNGRWAKSKGLPRISGHNAGMKSMTNIVQKASDMGIKHLTVYAFSTENWKRSKEEIGGIFSLVVKYVEKELRRLVKNNVKVRIFGELDGIPKASLESIERTVADTLNNTGMQFNICLNYGGRQDIVRAVNHMLREHITEATEAEMSKYLYSGIENGNVPDPDLVIRTSGEQRISNFLLWQIAYSELAFTNTLWPDFTPEEFETIINDFANRDRRFGGRNED